MKRQDLVKYHEQSVADLQHSLADLTAKWQAAKMDLSFHKLKNVHEPKNLRHNLARLKTILRAKILSGAAVQAPAAHVQSSSAKIAKKSKES